MAHGKAEASSMLSRAAASPAHPALASAVSIASQKPRRDQWLKRL